MINSRNRTDFTGDVQNSGICGLTLGTTGVAAREISIIKVKNAPVH